MIDGIGIAMALLTGAAISLLLTVAHYQRAAARRRRYELEAAQDEELHVAARARLCRYTTTGPHNSAATSP
jgi:hypothetical protein